ncbi:MAG: hypothetical protein CSA07_00650 [Bacteroidia bacterium]|nr:MAG: hypothetical protein CSA07_00650 [Bacteroidia bacterium]
MAGGPASAQKFYQCQVGEVADVKVWAAETPEEADFWAYFVYDASELGGPGVVMQVPTAAEAAFKLTFVDKQEEADFSLWLIEDKAKAGWHRPERSRVLDKYIKKK